MVIDPLHAEQPYQIEFTANAGHPDAPYYVLTGWVSTGNGAELPKATQDEVHAGDSCALAGITPKCSDAYRLRIDVTVPHPSAEGTLVVTQGDAKQTIPVTDDVTFLCTLIP